MYQSIQSQLDFQTRKSRLMGRSLGRWSDRLRCSTIWSSEWKMREHKTARTHWLPRKWSRKCQYHPELQNPKKLLGDRTARIRLTECSKSSRSADSSQDSYCRTEVARSIQDLCYCCHFLKSVVDVLILHQSRRLSHWSHRSHWKDSSLHNRSNHQAVVVLQSTICRYLSLKLWLEVAFEGIKCHSHPSMSLYSHYRTCRCLQKLCCRRKSWWSNDSWLRRARRN